MKKLNKKQFWNEIFKLRSYGDFMFSRWRTQKTLAYRILSKDTTPIKQLYVQIFLRKLFRSILIAVVGACICIMWNLIKESAILDGISYIIIIVCLTLIIGEYYIGMDKYILLREQRKRNMYKNFPKIAPLVITEIELEKEKFQKHIQEKKTELEICNGFLKEIDIYNQLLIIKNALGNKVYTLHPKFIKKEILVQLIMQEAIGTIK